MILGFRPLALFLGLFFLNAISTTTAKKSKEEGPTADGFEALVLDGGFRAAFKDLVMKVLRDELVQKKFVTMMKAIAEGHDGQLELDETELIESEIKKWGWDNPSEPSPKEKKWITGFVKISKKPEYLKPAISLFKFTIGDPHFRKTFQDFLVSTKIEVKDQRQKKEKPKKLTEKSVEYSDV